MSTTFRDLPSALRTRQEEFDAAATHGVAAVLSLIAGVYLVTEAVATGDPWRTVGCLIYAVSMFSVFTASTLSHLYLPRILHLRCRAYDQGCIYLLAVGSLSPFALTYLRTPLWMTFYAISVTIAMAGFVSKVAFFHRLERISLQLYLVQGWSQAFALIPLSRILPFGAFLWIIAGAVFYCVGVVFLMLDVRRYRFHAIWHLFVVAACVCHYYAILKYVAQTG